MLSWKLQTYRYLTEKKKEKKDMDYKNTGIRFCNVSIRDSFVSFLKYSSSITMNMAVKI